MGAFGIVLAAAASIYDMANNAMTERTKVSDPIRAICRFANYPNGFYLPSSIITKPKLNPDFWLKDVDFSCASPWNSAMGRLGAGTAVTKRHILYSNHFMMRKGTRIVFVGQDGEVCPCYLEGSETVGPTGLMVGLLNAELTPNITPAKVLPKDYAKYIGDGVGFPVVAFNQNEQVSLASSGDMVNQEPYRWGASAPTNSAWSVFQKKIIGGDSGNPVFMIIGNQAILVYCLYGGGWGVGNSIHAYRREIQVAMDKLCPGYKLEEFDFKELVPTVTKVPDDL